MENNQVDRDSRLHSVHVGNVDRLFNEELRHPWKRLAIEQRRRKLQFICLAIETAMVGAGVGSLVFIFYCVALYMGWANHV